MVISAGFHAPLHRFRQGTLESEPKRLRISAVQLSGGSKAPFHGRSANKRQRFLAFRRRPGCEERLRALYMTLNGLDQQGFLGFRGERTAHGSLQALPKILFRGDGAVASGLLLGELGEHRDQ